MGFFVYLVGKSDKSICKSIYEQYPITKSANMIVNCTCNDWINNKKSNNFFLSSNIKIAENYKVQSVWSSLQLRNDILKEPHAETVFLKVGQVAVALWPRRTQVTISLICGVNISTPEMILGKWGRWPATWPQTDFTFIVMKH